MGNNIDRGVHMRCGVAGGVGFRACRLWTLVVFSGHRDAFRDLCFERVCRRRLCVNLLPYTSTADAWLPLPPPPHGAVGAVEERQQGSLALSV